MKIKDVVIGGCYMTRVSGDLVQVKVVGFREGMPGEPRRFRLIKMDASRSPLPKSRTAAALRLVTT